MEKIEFEGVSYNKKNVSAEIPKEIKQAVKSVDTVANKCLQNSIKVSRKTGSKMVEGYLVTKFYDNQLVECVGHVWNEYEGLQFDVSAALIQNVNVRSHEYFPVKIYEVKNALIQAEPFPNGPLSFVFRTNAKRTETKVRDLLNKMHSDSEPN